MSDWKAILNADPTNWLLEEENPSVRYFTLKDVLDKPEHDPEVQQTKRKIMQYGKFRKSIPKDKKNHSR